MPRFHVYTVKTPTPRPSETDDDVLCFIPRRMLPEIIEGLAKQLNSRSRKRAVLRFYSGKLTSR